MEEETPSRTSGEEKVPCAAETMRVIGMAERYVKKNKLQKGQIWCVYDKDSFPADDFNGVVLRAERLNTKSLINDESDDRNNVFYCKQLLVDVDEDQDISSAYRMDNEDFPFGYEFVRKATLREINFGESDMTGEKLSVSGVEEVRKGFRICRYCGKIQTEHGKANHSFVCKTRKMPALMQTDAYEECLFLYREFSTEILRLLVPATTMDSTSVKMESFVAAFMLGMKEYFGNVDHLRATVSEVPVPDADYRKQYRNGISDYIFFLEGRKVRILKFYLPSGTVETLITNDFDLAKELFRQCYFLRWPVEENYKLVKEKIGLTNFRGYSENSVLQEFWISVLLANLALAIKRETDGIVDSTINQKGNQNKYMTNMNELVGYLSRHIGEYMDADTDTEKYGIIRCIFDFAVSHRVRDKKGSGESNLRTTPRKVKHHYNNKTTH